MNVRASRSVLCPLFESIERFWLTGSHRFNAAVSPIAYPTGELQSARLHAHRITKADALHVAANA